MDAIGPRSAHDASWHNGCHRERVLGGARKLIIPGTGSPLHDVTPKRLPPKRRPMGWSDPTWHIALHHLPASLPRYSWENSSTERDRGHCRCRQHRVGHASRPALAQRVIDHGRLASPPKGGCRLRLVSPISLRAGTSTTPHRRWPTHYPRPGGRLSAIHRRRGRSLGVGIPHGPLKSLPSEPWGS
jgi:hypothetical protein